jgi:hypothetical protein
MLQYSTNIQGASVNIFVVSEGLHWYCHYITSSHSSDKCHNAEYQMVVPKHSPPTIPCCRGSDVANVRRDLVNRDKRLVCINCKPIYAPFDIPSSSGHEIIARITYKSSMEVCGCEKKFKYTTNIENIQQTYIMVA